MKYLIAVDGSKASQAAVKYTVSLFKNTKGENHITLLTVQDDTALKLFKKYTQKGAVDDYLREGADSHLTWAIRFLNKSQCRSRHGHQVWAPQRTNSQRSQSWRV